MQVWKVVSEPGTRVAFLILENIWRQEEMTKKLFKTKSEFMGKKASLTLQEQKQTMLKTNYAVMFNNPNIKATCGCGESLTMWLLRTALAAAPGKLREPWAYWRHHGTATGLSFIMHSCCRRKTVVHFENEVSVFDFRSGTCILFRGQNGKAINLFGLFF